MRAEYRKNRRHYVVHGARIVGPDGSGLVSCRMLDVSGTGARLEVKGADSLPDQLVLVLSHDGRLRRQCSVVWRSETAIGVEFAANGLPRKGE